MNLKQQLQKTACYFSKISH